MTIPTPDSVFWAMLQHDLCAVFGRYAGILLELLEKGTHPIHLFKAVAIGCKAHYWVAKELQRANEGLKDLPVLV